MINVTCYMCDKCVTLRVVCDKCVPLIPTVQNFWNREIEEVLWRTRTHMVSRRAAAQPISRRMHTSLSSDDEDPDLAVPPILTEQQQQQQLLSARIEDYEDEEQQQLQQYEDGMDSEFDEPGESLHSSAADAPLMEIAQQPRKRKLENQREVQAKKKKKKKKKSSKDAKLQVSEIQQQDGKKRQSWLKREDQVCGEFAQFLGQSVISRVEGVLLSPIFKYFSILTSFSI